MRAAAVKATPVSATVFAFGFVMVNVKVEVPPCVVLVGLNALAITGGATTVRVAVLLTVPGLVSGPEQLTVAQVDVLLYLPNKSRALLDTIGADRRPLSKSMTEEERQREHQLRNALASLNNQLSSGKQEPAALL